MAKEDTNRKHAHPKRKQPKPPKIPSNWVNRGGRPRSFSGAYDMFDPRALEVLEKRERIYHIAALGGSQEDCARHVGITQSTVTQSYREDYYLGKLDLKMRIRFAQLMKAFEGDSSLLKHLGIAHCEEQKESATSDLSKQTLQSGIEKLTENSNTSKAEK